MNNGNNVKKNLTLDLDVWNDYLSKFFSLLIPNNHPFVYVKPVSVELPASACQRELLLI